MQKRIITFFWAFCALIIPSISNAQQTIGLFTKNIREQDGYVLFSPNSSKENYLIDKCGKLVHEWNAGEFPGLDSYILPNGNLLSTGKLTNKYFSSTGSV